MLLDKGANVSAVDSEGNTALSMAKKIDDEDMIMMLKDAGDHNFG